jgi:hypothetical protein
VNVIEIAFTAAGVIFGAGGMAMVLRFTRRDVNGLGRKFWASVACQVRCVAEEVNSAPAKAKLLYIANLIEGK